MNILDLIFPKSCLECGKASKYICGSCVAKVGRFGWQNSKGIRIFSCFEYEGVVKKAIIALKYKYASEVARELVDNLTLPIGNFCLVPIPMFWQKKNERGFNQTEILGELISNKMGFEYLPDLLIKRVNTPAQVGLKGKLRESNVLNSFEVNIKEISKVHFPIIIFDDVYTTGSTIKEAIKVLKEEGFKNVSGLTIAR